MHIWSTDDVPEHERFASWREWRASQLFGLTAEIDPGARRSFQAKIKTKPIGTAALVELKASAYVARRTEKDIARVRSESLCIYAQQGGPAWAFGDGRRVPERFGPFSMAIGYSDLPYETIPLSNQAFKTRLIRIPLTKEQDPDRRRETMAPRLLHPTPGLNALLHDYVQSFFLNAGHLGEKEAEAAIEVMAKLAFLAHASSPEGGAREADRMDGGPEAVTAAKLALLQTHICENLHRADLSPEIVARAFHMSVRQLHRLFQPSGTTFARFLLGKRVERAARLLCAAGRSTIIDIAFACGFSGSSVFYRAFKSHFGLNPQDYLRSLAGVTRGSP